MTLLLVTTKHRLKEMCGTFKINIQLFLSVCFYMLSEEATKAAIKLILCLVVVSDVFWLVTSTYTSAYIATVKATADYLRHIDAYTFYFSTLSL